MQVIGFGNQKGGVAKTTLSINFAAYLAASGYRVMLVDADAQAHATIGVGIKAAPGLFNLIVRAEETEYKDVLRPIPPSVYTPDGQSKGALLLLPGNVETGLIAQHVQEQGDLFTIRERFHELDDRIDFVIVDTSPTPSLLHTSLYYAMDIVFCPTEPEYFSMNSLSNTLANCQNYSQRRQKVGLDPIQIGAIIPMMCSSQTIEHQENLKSLHEKYPEEKYGGLITAPIPVRTTWREASGRRQSVFAYDNESKAAAEALALMQHLESVANAS